VVDTISQSVRSRVMSSIRSRDTKPELAVRRIVHSLGYRYRLHKRSLPGSPDIVLTSCHCVIFVHGCFWHGHPGCGRVPKSRLSYWIPKLERTRLRDKGAVKALRQDGWKVLVIWECDLVRERSLSRRIAKFLQSARSEIYKPKPSRREQAKPNRTHL
jgi:DNA mismatch endonuclease (patch repair protein)